MAVLGLMTTLADGATYRYRQGGDWSTLYNGAGSGWALNNGDVAPVLPSAADDARINFGGNTVTVTSNVGTVNRVQIGVDENGNVDVQSGGVLATSSDFFVGNNNSAVTDANLFIRNGGAVNVGNILWSSRSGGGGASMGNIIIDAGGLLSVGNHLWLGAGAASMIDISGTLTQSGGILGLGTTNASSASGGSATVNIFNGGLLALNNISGNPGEPSIQSGSVIDLSLGGLLTVEGNRVGTLNSYIAADKITGLGATDDSNLNVSFDGLVTTVSVVPEPSSALFLGLVATLGLGRRRR